MDRHGDVMQDPRFAPLLFAVESKVHEADLLAARLKITLTDSAVRSVLLRAANAARGRPPKTTASLPGTKDRLLADLLDELNALRREICLETTQPDRSVVIDAVPVSDWLLTLECLKDSCELRTGPLPGSRHYLDYLRDFIRKAP